MSKEEERYEYEVHRVMLLGAERSLAETIVKHDDFYKRGLWQYMIDHHTVQPDGTFKITFNVRSKKDFLWRVQCRVDGDFQRYEREESEKYATTIKNLYLQLKNFHINQGSAEKSRNPFIRILARWYWTKIQKKKPKIKK